MILLQFKLLNLNPQFKRLNSNVACFIVTTSCHCNTNNIALFCTAYAEIFLAKSWQKEPKKYQNETEQDKMVETYKENKKGNKICYS